MGDASVAQEAQHDSYASPAAQDVNAVRRRADHIAGGKVVGYELFRVHEILLRAPNDTKHIERTCV